MRYWPTYLMSVTVAFAITLLAIIAEPQHQGLIVTVLAVTILWPVWVALSVRTWKWFARLDVFSPLVAFPLAYISWFLVGYFDFVELPSSFSFGAFDPIPARLLGYALVGLIGYFAGAWSARRLRYPGSTAGLGFRFGWNRGMFSWFVLALTVIAMGTYGYIGSHIGIPALRPNAAEARLELDKYHWFGTPFFAAAYTLLLAGAGRIWTDRSISRRDVKVFVIGWVVPLLLIFLSMAGRAILAPPLLSALVMYHYLRRRITLRTFVVFILVAFALLSALGYVRDLTASDSMTEVLADAGIPATVQPFVYCYLYVRYSVATLRDISEVIPGRVPYQHGSLTLMPFQSLLPGHHQMVDYFYKKLLGNDFLGAGQPATILGTFYADLGPVGIFLGMFAFGLLLSTLYRRMQRQRTLFSSMLFAWATQAGLMGLFGGIFTFLDTLMIPLCWAMLNLFIREEESSSSQAALPAGPAMQRA